MCLPFPCLLNFQDHACLFQLQPQESKCAKGHDHYRSGQLCHQHLRRTRCIFSFGSHGPRKRYLLSFSLSCCYVLCVCVCVFIIIEVFCCDWSRISNYLAVRLLPSLFHSRRLCGWCGILRTRSCLYCVPRGLEFDASLVILRCSILHNVTLSGYWQCFCQHWRHHYCGKGCTPH